MYSELEVTSRGNGLYEVQEFRKAESKEGGEVIVKEGVYIVTQDKLQKQKIANETQLEIIADIMKKIEQLDDKK